MIRESSFFFYFEKKKITKNVKKNSNFFFFFLNQYEKNLFALFKNLLTSEKNFFSHCSKEKKTKQMHWAYKNY